MRANDVLILTEVKDGIACAGMLAGKLADSLARQAGYFFRAREEIPAPPVVFPELREEAMLPMLKNLGKSAAFAGALGFMALLGSSASASAHYMTTRCDSDGDHCWVVRCDDDGDDCRYVRDYYASPAERRDAHWVCDWDGDDCHWVYDHPHESPSIGLSFGFSN